MDSVSGSSGAIAGPECVRRTGRRGGALQFGKKRLHTAWQVFRPGADVNPEPLPLVAEPLPLGTGTQGQPRGDEDIRVRRGIVAATATGVLVIGAAAYFILAPPLAFTTRAEFESCGTVELGLGEEVPQEANQCLIDGRSEGAELQVRHSSAEGDPIVSYYRVGPDIDGVEVFRDATEDKFGSRSWEYMRCNFADRPTVLISCDEPE